MSHLVSSCWKRIDIQPRSDRPETFVISIDYHIEGFPVLTGRSTDSTMADIDVLSGFPGGKLPVPGLIRNLTERLAMRVQLRYYHYSSRLGVCS